MTSPPRFVHAAIAALLVAGLMSAVGAAAEELNGSWVVDEAASDDFDEAGEAFNRELNERQRRNQKQTFNRDSTRTSGGNRYDAQLRATEEMIREDNRSRNWVVPDELRVLLEAESIKLYEGRKVAVLYDGDARRLLNVNPSGRAYSASGTTMTDDQFGRSLTWRDGDALVVETSLVSGDKLVERFVPGPEDGRMTVELRFQNAARGPWLEFGRIFDRES